MTFYAFGVNHLRAPVEIREAFALDEERKRTLYRQLDLSSELILLSTCNRTEGYLYGSREDVEQVRAALADQAGMPWPDDMAFFYQDEDAVRHVLEVAGGLKSLVLGDAQIFAQLKDAYRIAVEEQRVDTTMHRLLHTAFRTAKRVINETDLSTGAATIPYRAVEAARAHFHGRFGRPMSELRALIVGAGSMGRLAAEALRLEGISALAFTNRSASRGRDAADRYHAEFVAWDVRHRAAAQVDLVIVATSAADLVLFAEPFVAEQRLDHILIIDISVPRNVDDGIGDLGGVHIINVDQLQQVAEGTKELRLSSAPKARRIVDDMLGEFVSWVFHHQALQPAIEAIAETFETIRAQEVSRHHQRLSETDREELDRITRSIVQKVLAIPIVRLKSVEPDSIDFVHGVRLLHALFRRHDCDESAPTGSVAGEHASNDETSNAPRADAHSIGTPPEDCPITPQLGSVRREGSDATLDLDDVLRLFSASGGNASS